MIKILTLTIYKSKNNLSVASLLLFFLASCSFSGFNSTHKQGLNSENTSSSSSSSSNSSEPTDSTGTKKSNGIDPSGGSGGSILPGQSKTEDSGAILYVPTSYNSSDQASSVIILFNMSISQWKSIADQDNIFLVDTQSYDDVDLIFTRLNSSLSLLDKEYNVDRARIYLAGWSAGGNIALNYGTDLQLTDSVAGIMVFPGSGGSYTINHFKQASQQNKRAIPVYYAVGDQDTATGYYPGVLNEALLLAAISGYEKRIQTKVWNGFGHKLNNPALSEAWGWMKNFNSKN